MLGVSRAAVIQGWDGLVRDLGADPESVYEKVGLSPNELLDADNVIPTQTVVDVLALAAEITSCPHFGLMIAKRRDFNVYFGLLGQIFQASATVGDAIRECITRIELHTQGTRWELSSDGDVSNIACRLDDFVEKGAVQSTQLAVGAFWRLMRLLSDRRWHPTMVSFTFSEPKDTLVYKRFFGVPVLFGADENMAVFHSADLQIALPKHDEYLKKVLEKYAETIQMSRRRDITDDVKDLVRKNLRNGKTGIDQVARFFPFERRTLQRQLESLGTNFQQLSLEVRMDVAQDRLLNSNVTIARLADSLGYRDQGSFTKAFKAYVGFAPVAWRRKMRQNTVPNKD